MMHASGDTDLLILFPIHTHISYSDTYTYGYRYMHTYGYIIIYVHIYTHTYTHLYIGKQVHGIKDGKQ